MIPLIDDYIQIFLVERLTWLKNHSKMLDYIFYTGQRSTLEKLRDFIENHKIRVTIGYPKDQTSLPAYVITLAPEQEQPIGLGDETGTFNSLGVGIGDDREDDMYLTDDEEERIKDIEEDVQKTLIDYLAATYMNATYRIECWSDNGDLTAYMYIILKWCLWSCRQDMLKMGWVNITMSGSDLEPVPDYMPIFIYRRAAQITITYENIYYENVNKIGKYVDVLDDPKKYHKDENGNIVDENGNIIIPQEYSWILKAHYYEVSSNGVESSDICVIEQIIRGVYNPESNNEIELSEGLKARRVSELPKKGKSGILYLLLVMVNENPAYRSYIWVNDSYVPIGVTDNDLKDFTTVMVVDKKDEKTLAKAIEYTDSKTYTAEDVGVRMLGVDTANQIFNSVFGKE